MKGGQVVITLYSISKSCDLHETMQSCLFITLLKLVIVIPATNASSERNRSVLRRVKSYLRTTMSQVRLNHVLILHAHKERTDSLQIPLCLNEFVAGSEHRLSIFGTFC